jgi:glycine cleavage system H protein
MPDFLEFTLDKFTFGVAADRLYSPEGVWASADGRRVTVGVSDFAQQHSGDVAFAEVFAVGRAVARGEPFATVETIKVTVDLPAPAAGMVVEANPALDFEAEVINQDPYGAGWLAIIEATDWESDRARLMSPEAYFEHMKAEAEAEVGN